MSPALRSRRAVCLLPLLLAGWSAWRPAADAAAKRRTLRQLLARLICR